MLISSCGLRLKNEDIRVAVGFQLGTILCKPHQCPCGALVEFDVTRQRHVLSCKLNASKYARHNVINDLRFFNTRNALNCDSVYEHAVTIAGISCVKKPQDLSRSNKK